MKFNSLLTAGVFALALLGTLPVMTACEDGEKEEKEGYNDYLCGEERCL